MTCTHVLGLIDAGPFADYPRAHLDAAWQHARRCATCGPALEAAAALTEELTALPEPAPAPDMAAAVLARIARLEQAQGVPTAAVAREAAVLPAMRDWAARAAAVGGLAAGIAIVGSVSAGEWTPVALPWTTVLTMTDPASMLPATTSALVLTVGLVLYAVGLFAPLSDPNARRTLPDAP
jgi:hypothetical protein